MGTGSGYRGDTYISRRVNLSTAMEFCGYDSNLCSCGDGGSAVQTYKNKITHHGIFPLSKRYYK